MVDILLREKIVIRETTTKTINAPLEKYTKPMERFRKSVQTDRAEMIEKPPVFWEVFYLLLCCMQVALKLFQMTAPENFFSNYQQTI